MIKKTLLVISLCIVLTCSGCENVQQLLDAITEDVLYACDVNPSSESYWNDTLVFLNQFDPNVRLYGISAGEKSAMLLYVGGEKVFIDQPFRNLYEEIPQLNVCDVDGDGMDEVIISLRTFTGFVRRYAIWVCDYKDGWNAYVYEGHLQDVEDTIKYKYDDESKTIIFLDVNGRILWKDELPAWTSNYSYTGVVNFENDMGFDAGTFQMDVVPQIELKDSLPWEPIRITFDLGFANGNFEIVSCEVQKYERSEAEGSSTAGSQEPPSEEEIAALGIREDMLAYWEVLNNKRAFHSWNEGGQKFFWNEYFWDYMASVCEKYYADNFMVVDMDGDGREEIVLDCFPGTTNILHYEDGEVYGYWFGTRGMSRVYDNGVYIGSDGAADNYYLRLTELNKDGWKEETLAEMHGGYPGEGYYEVGGKEVTEDEFWAYVESLENLGSEEMVFSESMLDRQLLGNLSGQELALVKRLPVKDVLEKEPDYQEHKQALQTYAAVLTGKQDVIHVTENDMEDDIFAKYFSLVDMDGDGSLELVFTCNFDFFWILHHDGGKVRGYWLSTSKDRWRGPFIATDGVFQTEDGSLSSTGYARIVSFEEDGYRTESVEGREATGHDWIRYYFYSEETIAQWLE